MLGHRSWAPPPAQQLSSAASGPATSPDEGPDGGPDDGDCGNTAENSLRFRHSRESTGFIYVYRPDPSLGLRHFRLQAACSRRPIMGNLSSPIPGDPIYAGEAAFTDRLLFDWSVRTSDPRKASLFCVSNVHQKTGGRAGEAGCPRGKRMPGRALLTNTTARATFYCRHATANDFAATYATGAFARRLALTMSSFVFGDKGLCGCPDGLHPKAPKAAPILASRYPGLVSAVRQTVISKSLW